MKDKHQQGCPNHGRFPNRFTEVSPSKAACLYIQRWVWRFGRCKNVRWRGSGASRCEDPQTALPQHRSWVSGLLWSTAKPSIGPDLRYLIMLRVSSKITMNMIPKEPQARSCIIQPRKGAFALQFASPALRGDRMFVLAAVQCNGPRAKDTSFGMQKADASDVRWDVCMLGSRAYLNNNTSVKNKHNQERPGSCTLSAQI